MGAVAITTLAGARLDMIAGDVPWLGRLAPAITVVTVASWAVATWWIPLLLILGGLFVTSSTGGPSVQLSSLAVDQSFSFSPDGRRVVTASDDRTARLWDAADGAALANLRRPYGSGPERRV